MVRQRIAFALRSDLKLLWNVSQRHSSSTQTPTPPSSAAAAPISKASINDNVPGLSSKCLNVPNSAVGPGASFQGEYKVPEYFCYDKTSYFEAEIEMLKYRCPQPSSKV
uniref:NADH dehydrogenase [ubiquinone] flavoprotein 3, mitochondrial n=1 Tax=Lygus hesperus TaxID=30085 RepID=A0A0A9YC39_LYGHE